MSGELSIEKIFVGLFVGLAISILLIYRAFKGGFSFRLLQDLGIVIILSMLLISIGGIVISELYRSVVYPIHKATIVKVAKYDSLTAATYKINVNNTEITSKAHVYTSTEKIIGDNVLVYYKDGYVQEKSSTMLIRYIITSFLLLIPLFILIAYVNTGLFPKHKKIFRPKKLHKAAANNDTKTIKHYLLKGIDVNTLDKNGLSPLVIAIENNAYESVQVLLSNGADIRRIDEHGETVLHTACYASDIAMIKLLIRRGVKVNLKDNDGNTALHYACEDDDDNLEIVKFLLQNRAEIDAQNNEHKTPLHIAVEYNNEEIVSYLLEKNADISLKDHLGLTAREVANEDISKLFLDKKDSPKSNYIKLIDTTNTDANVSFIMGIISMGIAWYNWSSAALFMIPFALGGSIFLLVAILNKISILLYDSMPIFIDKRTLRSGKTFKGYILSTPILEEKLIISTLSNIKTTILEDSDRTSSREDTVWEGVSEGKSQLIGGSKVIYFEIPIKKGLKKNKDGHSWSLLLKSKSLNFILRRKYDID